MTEQKMSLHLKEIKIKGFKAIDELVLHFPAPEMKGDPNIFVIGSKNGVGKTSIMEAISSLFFICLSVAEQITPGERKKITVPRPLRDIPIREGEETVFIKGIVEIGGKEGHLQYEYKNGSFDIKGKRELVDGLKLLLKMFQSEKIGQSVNSLYGKNNEPLYLPHFLYFHSFRKIQEGNIGMGMLVDESSTTKKAASGYEITPVSLFKMEILRALMSQGGLFETKDKNGSYETLKVLNDLVREFAGGTVDKLRPAPDNTMEFRVTPVNGGETFSFDGLSSGQKEIISTLFLIWNHTKEKPSIVLIDEPELHLNSEWHRKIVQYLNKLAPQNQYILATHSEDIFASVDPERRILLEPDGGEPA